MKLKALILNPNRNLNGHNKPSSSLDLPNPNICVKLTSGNYAETRIFQKWKLNCELSINSSNSKIERSKRENTNVDEIQTNLDLLQHETNTNLKEKI